MTDARLFSSRPSTPPQPLSSGYKSHISIDRKFQLIRKWKTIHAAARDGARLREGLLDKTNTASNRLGRHRLSLESQCRFLCLERIRTTA